MNIKTVKHLAYILKLQAEELLQLSNSVDNFYYTKNEPKLDKDNNPKFKNGVQLFRTLNPSIDKLKIVQKKKKKK